MTKTEYQRFVYCVVRMFQSGHSPYAIIDWTLGAQSGFGRFWASKVHAGRAVRYVRDAITAVARDLSHYYRTKYHERCPSWRRLGAFEFFPKLVAEEAKEKIDDLAKYHFEHL